MHFQKPGTCARETLKHKLHITFIEDLSLGIYSVGRQCIELSCAKNTIILIFFYYPLNLHLRHSFYCNSRHLLSVTWGFISFLRDLTEVPKDLKMHRNQNRLVVMATEDPTYVLDRSTADLYWLFCILRITLLFSSHSY